MTEPSTLEDRIQASKPLDEGWTNRVYETSEGTIIKVFSTHIFEAVIFGLADILHGKPNFPFRRERLQKEIEVKNSLTESGYEVPEVIEVYPHAIEMEKVEGRTLSELVEDAEIEEVQRLGRRTGELISGLHEKDFSLGDATFENFYIHDEKICTIDHEYSSMSSDLLDKERDVIHLFSDALEQETGKYKAFREGFEEAYRKFNRPEMVLAAFFSVLTSILGLQPYRIKRTLSNTVKF